MDGTQTATPPTKNKVRQVAPPVTRALVPLRSISVGDFIYVRGRLCSELGPITAISLYEHAPGVGQAAKLARIPTRDAGRCLFEVAGDENKDYRWNGSRPLVLHEQETP